MHVQYDPDEQRPVRHVRPRKRDCSAEIGTAASFDEAREFIGHRCKGCHRCIFRVRFPVTDTLPDTDIRMVVGDLELSTDAITESTFV